jgi:hypothetical protein
MRSDKQTKASKNNGKTSKGPVTPEGKAKSSRNAVLHNLTCGRLVLLPDEDRQEFYDFQTGYFHRFQPADSVEVDLVEKLIAAAWRERRILGMEGALFEIEMDRQSEAVDDEWERITPASRQVLVLFGATDATAAANLLLRYKAAARREYASTLRNLRDLQGPRFNRFRGAVPDVGPYREPQPAEVPELSSDASSVETQPAARFESRSGNPPSRKVVAAEYHQLTNLRRLNPPMRLSERKTTGQFSEIRNEPDAVPRTLSRAAAAA